MLMQRRVNISNNRRMNSPAWVLILLLISVGAHGAVVEVQPLHFGVFALVNNASVSTLTIPYTNTNPVASSKLYPITHGQAGHYQLSGYPAFTPLTITIADFQLSIGMSEPLTIGSFTFDPVMTDGNGDALLKVGATLSTSGNSNNYGDAAYSGNIDILISW